jgi:nicotinamidase-related amidase
VWPCQAAMLGPPAALVIIDLQNDFLAPSASFAVDDKAQISLRDTLEKLVPAFRSAGGHIIWIKSHYALATKEWKDKVNAETFIHSDTPTPAVRLTNILCGNIDRSPDRG